MAEDSPDTLSDDYWLGTRADLEERKEIKVKIPVRHLVKLHFLKISKGQEISQSVVDALTEYFQKAGVPHDQPDEAVEGGTE